MTFFLVFLLFRYVSKIGLLSWKQFLSLRENLIPDYKYFAFSCFLNAQHMNLHTEGMVR